MKICVLKKCHPLYMCIVIICSLVMFVKRSFTFEQIINFNIMCYAYVCMYVYVY